MPTHGWGSPITEVDLERSSCERSIENAIKPYKEKIQQQAKQIRDLKQKIRMLKYQLKSIT
jgi:hypothetical protein